MTLLQVNNHDRYKCLDMVVHDKLMSLVEVGLRAQNAI
jgi:hypothetical protein